MIKLIITEIEKNWCYNTKTSNERVLSLILEARRRLAAIWVSNSDALLAQEFDRQLCCEERVTEPDVTAQQIDEFIKLATLALFPALEGYRVAHSMYHTSCCGVVTDVTVTFTVGDTQYSVYGDDGNPHDYI